MSEFVKKTAMGYKAVAGGQANPECSHVILTKGEYEQFRARSCMAEARAIKAVDEAEERIITIEKNMRINLSRLRMI